MLFFILFLGCYFMATRTNNSWWWFATLALSALATLSNVMAYLGTQNPVALLFSALGVFVTFQVYRGFRNGR